ncbi:MAG: ATP-NAD kinase, partial [Anaerolineae bacterium]
VQSLKSASPPGEQAAARAIAWAVVEQMSDEWLYLVGPGTTTRAITDHLGLSKTLIGVDVIFQKKLLLADANEAQLRQLLAEGRPAKIIVTPIGGQGYILGRGNQQFSPAIIRQVGRENLLVVSAPGKIHALHGRPLQVDTGDPALDTLLKGHIRVITGYNEHIIYRLSV